MKTKKKKKIPIIIVVSALVLALVVGTIYFLNHNSSRSTITLDNGSTATSDPNVPTSDRDKNTPSSSLNSNPEASNDPAPSVDPGIQPSVPYGTFVSNHHPHLSGTPTPNTVSSSCTTTPGVSCTIRFVNGSTTKELPQQTTDASGNTSWNWSLQQIGLTEGEWTVTAVASNGNKTATSKDAMNLVVEQ